MSYAVLMDDGNGTFTNILDFSNSNKILIEPKLTMEVNEIGSFEFTMPPTHINYALPKVLKTTVEIYEDNDGSDPTKCIWFGRVLSIETDYYRQKKIICENALGWLNDVSVTFREYSNQKMRVLFSMLITDYYSQADSRRKIRPGVVTVENNTVSEQVGYDTTLNTIQSKCLDQTEGYIMFRKNSAGYWIDWLKNPAEDLPDNYAGNQPIEFGVNLIDLSSTLDGGDIFTAILPYGDTVRENSDSSYGDIIPSGDARIGKPLILTPGYESKIITSSWVNQYGLIVKPVHFSGVKRATDLFSRGSAYLNEYLYSRLTFELSAIDIAHDPEHANDNYMPFKLGQNVKCKSIPHGLVNDDPNSDGYVIFPLLKLEMELDSATKTISVGTAPRKKLTDYTLDQRIADAQSSELDKGLVFEIGKQILNPETGLLETVWERFKSGVLSIFTDNESGNDTE